MLRIKVTWRCILLTRLFHSNNEDTMRKISVLVVLCAFVCASQCAHAQKVTIINEPLEGYPEIDGFGTCVYGNEGSTQWFQDLYFNDAAFSVLRMDLVPQFAAPYSDRLYNCPWFHGMPALPGPEGNNVRSYTNATSYMAPFDGRTAPIAVMGPDIEENVRVFDYSTEYNLAAGALAMKGAAMRTSLGDFKLVASIWSPAPWLKIPSGNKYQANQDPLPIKDVPYPYIWAGNFVGGKLDVSNEPRPEFFDGTENTTALTQFARSTAAYVLGFQRAFGEKFYAISPQNELNFETFYNSCTYPQSSQYIAAVKVLRKEFDKYPELRGIKIIGPEDLLGGDAYGMWEYGKPEGAVDPTIHKSLKYLEEIAKDAEAATAIDFFCIHGYSNDGIAPAGGNPQLWKWWAEGWNTTPAEGLPAVVKGFTGYNKKSWMTESSGEAFEWTFPQNGFPTAGAYSIGVKIHQALTAGKQAAYIYWQMSDGKARSSEALTDAELQGNSLKLIAMKHYSKFIRPSAIQLKVNVTGSPNILCSSFKNVDGSIASVLINTGVETVLLDMELIEAKIPEEDSRDGKAITTTSEAQWKEIAFSYDGDSKLELPGYGIATLYSAKATSVENPETPVVCNVRFVENTVIAKSNQEIANIRIYTTAGEHCSMFAANNETSVFAPLPKLSPGVYIAVVYFANGSVYTERVIRN